MDATKARLGRGLDALIGGGDAARAVTAKVDAIKPNPYQPRKRFGEDELKHLADSVKAHGVLQPLVVRADGDGFVLIAGERRLKAARMAGLAEVPVHVVAFDDQQVFEAALVENIQRADLNPIEKALGFKDYLDKYKLSHDQLGAKLGIDRSSVSNLVGLLGLPADVQDAVRLGQVSLGHAKILKGLGDAERQSALCKQVILQNLSVHALDALVKEQKAAATAEPKADREPAARPEKTAHVAGLENDLRQRFAVKVEIKLKAKEKGQIVIGFESNDDFERIIAALKN
jgi:ParB family chromosome partitioning protein